MNFTTDDKMNFIISCHDNNAVVFTKPMIL